MEVEEYVTTGINIKVEIFDLDMMETIWPMAGDNDQGIWMPKAVADKYTDEQIGKWFLNRYLIDYCNFYEFTIIRGEEREMTFKRRIH